MRSKKTKKPRGGASYPCPRCGSPTQVRTTRLREEGVVRNRECGSCGEIFDTREAVFAKDRKKRAS